MLGRVFTGRRRQPRLSVVIPVYNVESYLAECLDSVLGQELNDLEVVLVDDGSTDGSAAIAADYARGHANVRLLQTENHGLGAARNLGARHVSGELLAFVDSDDIVPAYAYAVMVAALDESGSDLVVGSLQRRFDETGELVEPGFLRGVHQKRRLRVTIEEFPEVMRSVFACNKVFRTSFWHGDRLSFPEGVRYEDQPTIIEAYLRAGAIDVLRRPVYHWRIRADRSSITQRRHEVEDLRDRITTKLMTTQVVRSLGSPGLLDYWARNSLAGDMPHYFREIPGCSDDYWEVLRDGMSRMFDRLPPVWQSQLRVVHRLAGWLVVQNRRQDAERLLAYVIGNPGLLPLRVDGDHVVALLPLAEEPDTGIPAELFWLREHELDFDSRLLSATFDGGTVVFSAIALIRGAPPVGVHSEIRAWLRSSGGDDVPMAVERQESTEATQWVNKPGQDFGDSVFAARIDPRELAVGSWQVVVEVRVAEISRTGQLRSKAPQLELPSGEVANLAVGLAFSRDSGLMVTVSPL